MRKGKFILTGLTVSVLILVGFWKFSWRLKDFVYEKKYDLTNDQNEIHTKEEIRKVFNSLGQVAYSNLPQEYKIYTKSNIPPYRQLLLNKTYYIIQRDDLNRFVAGRVRLKELLPKDKYYKRSLSVKNQVIYFPMDIKVVYKLLELQIELRMKGYNPNGFELRNGYRHPRKNEEVRGAKLSRHIRGEAIDIIVKDVDQNGKYEESKDKQIILDLLEHKIIQSEGGIGRYPHTRSVHFDVRGKRARWDSY